VKISHDHHQSDGILCEYVRNSSIKPFARNYAQ
jgi:hypothetical protein